MLGLGMFFWSLFQAMSGMVHSFTQFVLVRIGMGIGEAPMNRCGVKVINDWFNIKERGRPMGFFNAASTIGVAVSPPILAAMMLVMGWRGMFITIGVLGIFLAIGWYMLYRNREHVELTAVEQAYLNAGSVNARRDPLSFAEWRSLFRNRTMWGMMLGFSGINYTAWLYLAWLPGYLQTAYNLDLKSTGLMAAIPFLFGAAGMLVNGYVTDWLVKGEWLRLKAVDLHYCRDVLFCRLYADSTTSDNIHDGGSADWHGTVLYSLCRNILLGSDPRRSCFSHDCVGGQYPELCQLHLRLFRADHYWFYC